ncbi:MAG: ABC transporter ATP-binding protein [Acetatifactor sp.]|nr:ABC transporter ATP-binding protein [Acetatifactor sp.]
MSDKMIVIENLVKKFQNTVILDHINISFEKGKIYGIVGYNGSGKTVLFKCICGFMKPSEGKITVNGKVIGQDTDMIPDAGIIIEQPAFINGLSGIRNLEMLYMIRQKKNRKRLEEVMRLVGLDSSMKKPVDKYSLGMKQRLAIAQAIMEDPSLLILDEPMNGLDKSGVAEMRSLFDRLRNEGKTIVFASHNREDISVLCDEVYEMENGSLTDLMTV